MGAAQRACGAARVFNDMCLTRTAADHRRGFDTPAQFYFQIPQKPQATFLKKQKTYLNAKVSAAFHPELSCKL